MIKQLNFSKHQRTFTPDNLKIRKEFGSLITNPEEETKDGNRIGFRNQYIHSLIFVKYNHFYLFNILCIYIYFYFEFYFNKLRNILKSFK